MKASLGKRYVAYLVDLLFIFFLTSLVALLFEPYLPINLCLGITHPQRARLYLSYPLSTWIAFLSTFFLISFLYWIIEGISGRTIGDILFGLEMDRMGKSSILYALTKLFIPFHLGNSIFSLFNENKQKYFDIKLKVIYSEREKSTLSYWFAGILIWILPVIWEILLFTTQSAEVEHLYPASLKELPFSLQFAWNIFRDNVKIGVIYMKWGLGLSILDIPLAWVSNYLTSLYIAAPVMMGKPALLLGLFHVPVEFAAFGCAVGSGLKITSIIFDAAESFLIERKDLKKDIKELLLLIALTLFLFAMAALIEEGITPELFRLAY